MSDTHKIVPASSVAVQHSEMHPLVKAAISTGGSIDTQTLRELMDLQREWEKGEAKKKFTQAMVDLKSQLPSVLDRDGSVDFGKGKTSFRYTTLAHAIEAVSPHLTRFGFALAWTPQTSDKMVSVTCRLTHTDGHFEETTLTAPADNSGSKNAVQSIGSTISYLQRYTALSLLGIATQDMKSPDDYHADKSQNNIDTDKNLQAVAYMREVGIDLKEAEGHVQKGVQHWDSSDLSSLRELVKQRKESSTND